MMRGGLITLLAVATVASCGPSEDSVLFDGQYYRARLDTDRDNRSDFTVSVRPVSASLAGAKEAARYEAVVYCVNRYGSSDITWVVGPDSSDESLTISDDTLFLRGECPS